MAKIIQLKSENFKRIKAVEITPDGNIVKIKGQNGQGKTSVIDSIVLALLGPNGDKSITEPLRKGSAKGSVTVDIGDYKVTRTYTSKGDVNGTLKVQTSNGVKVDSPQKTLDKLIGTLSFDPLAFAQMEPSKQAKVLMELIGFDHKVYKGIVDGLIEERRVINRQITDLEGAIALLPELEDDADIPDKEVTAEEIVKRLNEANETIKQNNLKRDELAKLKVDKAELLAKIEANKAELIVLEKQVADLQPIGAALVAECKVMIDPDVEAITAELTTLTATNKKVADKKKRTEMETSLKEFNVQSEAFTTKIQAAHDKKDKRIKEAKLPIDGLGVNDEGVIYKDIPFMQAAESERLRVSIAMGMAMNPELRVILIKDASLLDSNSMKVVEELAKDNDFQVWLEVVADEDDGVGIYIEDGTYGVEPVASEAPEAEEEVTVTSAEPVVIVDEEPTF